jgi:cobalt-zinc-cadmium efflux system outer membrane protein
MYGALTALNYRHIREFLMKKIFLSYILSFFVFTPFVCSAAENTGARCPVVSGAKNGLTIAQAVEDGVKGNLDLIAAKYDVSSARADELTAGLWYNPALTVDAVSQPFGTNWNQSTSGGPRQSDIAISYPLDVTNKKGRQKESAHQAFKAAEANFQDVVRKKVLEIRLAYVDVMLNEQLLSLAHEKEDNMQRLVELLKTRVGRKDILPLLQSRAQLALDQAVSQRKRKENDLRASKNVLSVLLGRTSLGKDYDMGTALCDLDIKDLPDREELIGEALSNRPDMKVLELSRLKAEADRKLAKAMILDNLSLGVGYTSIGAEDANPQVPGSAGLPGSGAWSASLGIPLPLFDRNQGNIEKARIAREQLDKQILSLGLSIRHDIIDLYDHIALTKDLIFKYEKAQLKNAIYVRDTQQRVFGTGAQQEGLLDYFDAIGAYNDTLADYYNTLADYWKDSASLNAAAGRDLK